MKKIMKACPRRLSIKCRASVDISKCTHAAIHEHNNMCDFGSNSLCPKCEVAEMEMFEEKDFEI